VLEGAPTVLASELPRDLDELGAFVDHDGIVISRATPEDKLRIAQALRARGHVVAMTGDGVNDGPALHAASIGVAMGRSGTDVAREAADIVLLDDDFATIVDAVAEGRATFLNVRRFLTYHLTDNVAELTPYIVWALSAGHFPLALTVMQILALDIGTDTASATALGAEPPSAHVLDGRPVSGRLLNHTVALRAFALFGPIEALMSLGAFVMTYVGSGWRPGDPFATGTVLYTASGAAFLTVILAQKANSWACRSASDPPWRLGWSTNRLLLYTAFGELLFGIACLTVPPVQRVLENRFPSVPGLLVAAASVPTVLVADALWKAGRARRATPRSDETLCLR
jgi:magnesium-transporting ATPase (P-type)